MAAFGLRPEAATVARLYRDILAAFVYDVRDAVPQLPWLRCLGADTVMDTNDARARLESDLAHAREAAQEKIDLLRRAEGEMRERFSALSADALKSNNASFLELATTTLAKFQSEAKGDLASRQKAVESLVAPIRESLDKVGGQVDALEKARREAYGALTEQVKSLLGAQEKLHSETGNLVKALRTELGLDHAPVRLTLRPRTGRGKDPGAG